MAIQAPHTTAPALPLFQQMATAMRAVRKVTVSYNAWHESAPWAKELVRRLRTAKTFTANPKVEFALSQMPKPALAKGQVHFGEH